MLLRRCVQYIALFLTTLLVSEQIPLIKTIDPVSAEASSLLSALSELTNGAKENIVEMITRPSDFFHGNENDQNPIVDESPSPSPASPPPEPPPVSPPEPPQSPEPTPVEDHIPRFLKVDGSKVIIELDLERVPGFDATRKFIVWVTYWIGVLFSAGLGADGVEQSYWLHALVPAALGFFGGLGYGFVGWCRWCLSRREAARTVEEAVVPKKPKRRPPANAYFESRLSQSYMMPLNSQLIPDPRRLRGSSPVVATKSEQAEEINATINRIAKKEEDADPLMVPSSLSDSSWYSPGSPLSPTQLNDKGLDLSSYDGFQPKPKVFHPDDLPDTLLGAFPPVASSPRLRKPSLPQISDPWSNYTPDNQTEELS